MKKLTQTRLYIPNTSRGNCFPSVIACIMDLDSPEDVIQIQELYHDEDWPTILTTWISERGWDLGSLREHQFNDEFYLVSGKSPRGDDRRHVCIYQNGKLYHDPHPDNTGLLSEDYYQYLEKL